MSAQLALYNELIHALEHAYDTRYLSAAGLAVLLYDHLLTLDDEIKYVWHAPTSIPKIGFLFNRYMVLACLLAIACEMCGFSITLSDSECRQFLFTMSMFGIASIGVANVLVLLRVVILWERRPLILRLMSFGFLSGFIVQFVSMILANLKLRPSVTWSPIAKMCIVSDHTPLYIAVWVSPMLFEILVIAFVVINALDRPRAKGTRITAALHADGVAYFLTLTCLRALNLALAATANPSLTLLTVFFVWAMTTTVLNRSLLNLRQAELADAVPADSGRASPFGARTRNRTNSTVQIVDMDDLTLVDGEYNHSGVTVIPDNGSGHRQSESVGSSTKLLRMEAGSERRRGSQESDWDPEV